MVKVAGVDIERALIKSHEDIALERVLGCLFRSLVARCRVAIAHHILQLVQRRAFAPVHLGEVTALHHGVVEALLLPGGQADLRQHFVDSLLAVLFRPDGFSVPVVGLRVGTVDVHHAQVDDVPMSERLVASSQFAGLLAGAHHTAVLGYDVARPDGEQGGRDGAGEEQGVFKPPPLVVQHLGVAAFLVGVIVVHEQQVRAYLFQLHAAGRLPPAHGHERHAAGQQEIILAPLRAAQVAVEVAQPFVGLELRPVDAQQLDGRVVRG